MVKNVSQADLAMRLLGRPLDALDEGEQRVIAAIADRAPTSRDAGDMQDGADDFGDRLADRVAAVGGSWGFIICFTLALFGWMVINSKALDFLGISFDPFPFIFLNLMLSTLAAIQAPVIMMSQNRQAEKDRLSARLDYEINLRAELEIMALHHKIDHLIEGQVAQRLEGIEARLAELARR
jgi:uncharacterized membrane protein